MADTLIPHAIAYYRTLEKKHAQRLFYPRHIHRLFADQGEKELWKRKRADEPSYQGLTAPLPSETEPCPESPSGFAIPNFGGYLDAVALLELVHTRLEQEKLKLSSTFNYDEIHAENQIVSFHEYSAPFAIFAEGHLATRNPHFDFIPYKPAKGVIATIKLASSCEAKISKAITLKGKFILPRHDGTIVVGATYNWSDPTDAPDPQGIQELEQFLDQELGSNNWQFEQVLAGVRPATVGAYPVIGPHPEKPQLYAFNGFGSKGSLQIPYFAKALVAVATAVPADTKQATLPSDVLPFRFIKKTPSKKRWIATDIAKQTVLAHLAPGDTAIDATAGNGHDTHWLAQAVGPTGRVFAFDIQEQAISSTRQRLEKAGLFKQVTLYQRGHEQILEILPGNLQEKIAAIVFNLGYLPGSDQSLITRPKTTLAALEASLQLLTAGGILSVTLYHVHPGGREEVEQVRAWHAALPSSRFQTRIERHPEKRTEAPYLIFVVKK